MTDKKYVMSEEELKQICTDYSASRRLNLNKMVQDFLKTKQPVEFLDRERVEGICRRMVKRAMKVALGDKRWGNQTVEKYVDAILSLAIPQPDEDRKTIRFPKNNKIWYGQDFRQWKGVPSNIDFEIGEICGDSIKLVADGYGRLGKGNKYGNGAIYVSKKDIPQPDEDKICTHSDKETEAYCENLQREIAYLNDELESKTPIDTDNREVIAEGVVRLECPTVGIGNSNIPSLNWFEIIKDYVGKQVKLILIKKGE